MLSIQKFKNRLFFYLFKKYSSTTFLGSSITKSLRYFILGLVIENSSFCAKSFCFRVPNFLLSVFLPYLLSPFNHFVLSKYRLHHLNQIHLLHLNLILHPQDYQKPQVLVFLQKLEHHHRHHFQASLTVLSSSAELQQAIRSLSTSLTERLLKSKRCSRSLRTRR